MLWLREQALRPDRFRQDAEVRQTLGPISTGRQKFDDLRHGGRRLEAIAALTGQPEKTGSVRREPGGRHPVGDEGTQPRPAMCDARDAERRVVRSEEHTSEL